MTFALVYFSWIFFRANNTADAFQIIGKTFSFSGGSNLNLFTFNIDFYIAFISIAILLVIELFEEYAQLSQRAMQFVPRAAKWAILVVVIFVIFVLGVWDEADFLYFQF